MVIIDSLQNAKTNWLRETRSIFLVWCWFWSICPLLFLFIYFFGYPLVSASPRKSTRRSCPCSSVNATQRSGTWTPMPHWVMEWLFKSSENCPTMVSPWGSSCKHLCLLQRWVLLPFSIFKRRQDWVITTVGNTYFLRFIASLLTVNRFWTVNCLKWRWQQEMSCFNEMTKKKI